MYNRSMNINFTLFLLLFSFGLSAKQHIVISGFEPFAQRAQNNSWATAKSIKEQLKNNSEIMVSLCLLPTIYDEASEILADCVANHESASNLAVSKVIGLGESHCSINFETLSHNKDRSKLADNAGVIHSARTIIPKAQKSLGFSLPVHKMYCNQNQLAKELFTVSDRAGSFVCNNTAFNTLHHFSDRFKFTFIHVPNSSCKNIITDHQKVATALIPAISSLTKASSEHGPLGIGANVKKMPTSFKEANKAYRYLKKINADKCEINFFKSLRWKLII